MGRKYYCDYCDRSFKDDTRSRKKHLSSLQHMSNRIVHYNSFKDPAVLLKQEKAKIRCKQFMSENGCIFDYSCRYSHYTDEMLWELQEMAKEKPEENVKVEKVPMIYDPNPDDIVKEFFENMTDIEISSEIFHPVWNLPSEIHNYPNLPPSLWPITPYSITNSRFGHWGK